MEPKDAHPTSDSPVDGEESLKWNGTYTWSVKKFTKLEDDSYYSPEFEVGGYHWRLLLFPNISDSQTTNEYTAVYLNFVEHAYMPRHMCPTARFKIKAMKKSNCGDPLRRIATHAFTSRSASWGFKRFLPLQEVKKWRNGYLVNDTLTLCVNVYVERNQNLGTRSRLRTGFVGIKTFAVTNVLSALLQCLFHIKAFRKAVFQMPNLESDDPQESRPLPLQHLFYKLQYQRTSLEVNDMDNVMEWGLANMPLRHDSLEIIRTLFEKLNEEDKAGGVKDCIKKLFMGEYSNYVESPDTQDAPTFKQTFTEIPLDVLECKDIYSSLEKFCQTKGLNKANSDLMTCHGMHASKQYTAFDSLPTVLILPLKRCYYNPDRDAFLKINSYFEFYDELDLDYNDRILLSKHADQTIENKYRLHTVLVHVGGPQQGHYCAFIRNEQKWYNFDDEVVQVAFAKEAIKEQFGDRNTIANANFSERFKSINKSAAVMLVYIRKSDWERVMCEAGKQHLPEQIKEKVYRERMEKEKRQKEKEEAHAYAIINLATEFHCAEQIGKKCFFGLANYNDFKKYRVLKDTPFEDFKEMVVKDFGIPEHLQRFWLLQDQGNNTVQVSQPLIKEVPIVKTILDLRYIKQTYLPGQEKIALMTINLFLETPVAGHRGNNGFLHTIRQNEMLIFVKYYDPASMELSYLGHLFVKKTSPFRRILERAKKMSKLGLEDEVIGFMEPKLFPNVNLSARVPERTPEGTRLVQGDIIIIQKLVKDHDFAFPCVIDFLDSIQST